MCPYNGGRVTLDEIISALEGHRDDSSRYEICADALMAEGEPQGQVMAMQLRGLDDATGSSELRTLAHTVLDAADEDDGVELEWRWGFLTAARFGGFRPFDRLASQLKWLTQFANTGPELVVAMPWRAGQTPEQRVRVHRLLRQLRTLHVGPWEIRPNHSALWTLFEQSGLPRTVEHLVIDDVPHRHRDEHQITWVDLGDLGNAWPAFSRLRELTLRGSYLRLGEIVAPELRRLTITSSTFNDTGAIRGARWPKLEELDIAFGDGEYVSVPASIDDVKAMVRELPPTVTRLGLRNLPFTDELIPWLAKSSPLERLTHLDLSLGVLFGAERALGEHAAAFQHLKRLDVTDTGLDDVERLTRQIPGLHREVHWRQKDHRYVSIRE